MYTIKILAIIAAITCTSFASAITLRSIEDGTQIDTQLRINSPVHGKKVRGQVAIKGKAKPNSSVKIKITGTYYELGKDMQKEKIFKGNGPIQSPVKTLTVKADRRGDWKTRLVDFRNHGWEEEFKIVATSVEGKNSTYVIVKDDTKPIIQWD